MSIKDYYEILGLSPKATDEEIKAAFRRLALRYHPDKNPGDRSAEERFRLISEAYSVLGDPHKRAEYDRKRSERSGRRGDRRRTERPQRPHHHRPLRDLLGGITIRVPRTSSSVLGRLFLSFLNTMKGKAPKGQWNIGDITVELTITMREASRGTKKVIEIRREEICPSCGGSGRGADSTLEPCTRCGGTGNVFMKKGNSVESSPCPVCDGTGFILTHPCPTCRGLGTIETPQRLSVKIPPGVKDKARIRIKGQGRLDPRGRRGDLYAVIRIKEDEPLRREGDDIYCELDVSFVDAALGATVEVKTLDGRARLRIPPGTQSGSILRMRGRGFPKPDGSRGDQYVRINVVIPENLTPEQRRLLERFRSLS
ncbi:TPA: molecular chaperone DnaJ [Candidatus Poribacteria bacterium]|nr:molecular chaperone DnaJ [Candidatus Poribacteria bacterium]HEX28660.1 molecular chaperone DnaJ [Candidatus Poribacteria bacterium]